MLNILQIGKAKKFYEDALSGRIQATLINDDGHEEKCSLKLIEGKDIYTVEVVSDNKKFLVKAKF